MSSITEMPARSGLVALVAENVRVESARRGWKQSEVARMLTTSRTSISARWMGSRPWTLEDLEKLAGKMGISPASFFARSEGLEPPTFWLVDADVIDLSEYRAAKAVA